MIIQIFPQKICANYLPVFLGVKVCVFLFYFQQQEVLIIFMLRQYSKALGAIHSHDENLIQLPKGLSLNVYEQPTWSSKFPSSLLFFVVFFSSLISFFLLTLPHELFPIMKNDEKKPLLHHFNVALSLSPGHSYHVT